MPKKPQGTLPVAPLHLPHRHTHAASPASWWGGPPVTHPGTHVSLCCWPQAHGDTGQACVAHWDCHHRWKWGWMGTEAHELPSCPVAPLAPCWHIPAQTPHYLSGGDKDTVPLHSPMAREVGAGVLVQDGVGEWSSGHSQSCPPYLVPAPPFCPLPACLCQGEGMGGREPLPARWMGEIKPNLVSLLAAKPGVLSALQLSKEKPGRGHKITAASPCPPEQAKCPPLSSHYSHH